MRWRRIVLALVVLLVAAVTGGLLYARPLLLTGTGYAAHNACAVRFVAERGPDAPDADLPPNPLVPYLRTSVSADEQSATTSVLGLLFRQTAYYTPGSGCTLTDTRPARAADGAPTGGPAAGSALPIDPTASSPAVEAALDAAFGVGSPADQVQRLGTRAMVVVHHGRIVAERYAPGFTPQTRQLGWSMGKSVTALLAGRLAQQGKLSLTDDHLRPEWTDARGQITVEQLLRMTSGLQWDETYDLGTPITRMLYLEPDMARYAASLPSAHAPGSYQQYSSGTTNVLCSVLHQRSGLGADLGARLLFDDLGIGSAVWEPDAAGHLVCSSYLWATPRDWATIGQFALQKGRWQGRQLLPADWMARTTTAVAVTGEEDGFAAHWWVNARPDGSLVMPGLPRDTYWASGHDGQRVIVIPSSDLVIVRMGFSPVADDLGIERWGHDLVGALSTS
ncbi:MAG: serine hydrolase [Kineosporiaceae bacterium]